MCYCRKNGFTSGGSRLIHSTAIENFNDLKIVLHALKNIKYILAIVKSLNLMTLIKFSILLLTKL